MAEYQKTIITNAGISILNRVLASKTTVTFTRAVSSTDDLSNKTESELRAMTSFGSIMQNGVCSRYNVHNQNLISLDLVFTNENLGNSYMINTVGLYAKASDSSTEVLYAIARAGKDTKGNNLAEQMPAYSGGLTKFTISLYTQVGQASSVSVSIIDEGVVKSVNGTIKPDANGNVILPFQSQAEANQLRTDLTNNINNTAATLNATIAKNKADADSKLEAEANTRAQNDNAFNNRLNALSDALTSETANRKNNIDSLNSTLKDAKAKAEANANSIQALSANHLNASGYTSITRTNGVNLNGFIELGSFYFPSSANCVNLPESEPQSQHGDICVENRKVGGTIIQKCYYVDLYGTVYIRTTSTNGGIWNSWAQIDGLYIDRI